MAETANLGQGKKHTNDPGLIGDIGLDTCSYLQDTNPL